MTEQHQHGVMETFRRRTPRSAEYAAAAARSAPIPNSRAAVQHAPYALTFVHGEGTWLTDADDNRYVDLVSNLFSLIHGNAYPPAVEAATRQIAAGSLYPGNHRPHTELAEQLVDRLPAVEQIHFCNSGTEAFAQALSIARMITGRYKFLMARRGYHGSGFDTLSGGYGYETPGCLIADYGDAGSFRAILEEHGDEIAAVVLEPVQGAGGLVAPPAGFLEDVHAAARKAGALFILDEVVTFRMAFGGMQASLSFKPDLVMLGKVIGGGFPVGAVGGSRDAMDALRTHTARVGASGTFSGNPVSMAAGNAVVRDLTEQAIARLNGMGDAIEPRLEALLAKHDVNARLHHSGSMLRFDFGERHETIAPLLQLAAANHGLLMHSRGLVVLNTAMDDSDIDLIVDRLDAAFGEIAA